MIINHPTSRTGQTLLVGALAAAGALAFGPSPAAADTNLGTVGGLTYIFDQSPAFTPPDGGGAWADCPSGTQVIGGGADISGGVFESYLRTTVPTDGPDADDRSDDAWLGHIWNASGVPRPIDVIAVCANRKRAQRSRSANVPLGQAKTLRAKCPSDAHVSGGGVYATGPLEGTYVNSSYPYDGRDPGSAPDDGWNARVYNAANAPRVLMGVFAICLAKRPVYRTAGPVPMTPGNATGSDAAACPGSRHISAGGVRLGAAPAAEARLLAIRPFDLADADSIPDDALHAKAAVEAPNAASMLMRAICL